MLIERHSGSDTPQLIQKSIKLGINTYRIAVDIIEDIISTEGDKQYCWSEIQFHPGIPSYAELVSSIIRCRYSADDIEAITCNHALDDGDEEHLAEWLDMQNWRKEAKTLAKEILRQIEEMN